MWVGSLEALLFSKLLSFIEFGNGSDQKTNEDGEQSSFIFPLAAETLKTSSSRVSPFSRWLRNGCPIRAPLAVEHVNVTSRCSCDVIIAECVGKSTVTIVPTEGFLFPMLPSFASLVRLLTCSKPCRAQLIWSEFV
jgi:hypothetical protein